MASGSWLTTVADLGHVAASATSSGWLTTANRTTMLCLQHTEISQFGEQRLHELRASKNNHEDGFERDSKRLKCLEVQEEDRVLVALASYPGSLIMWGRKIELGDYCIAHASKFPDFWEFVISVYSFVTDDVK